MRLLESGEMYLETILILHERNQSVRSIDIAAHMGYSKPSISRAMNLLRQGGYILTDPNGQITLTPSGRALAEKIYERHTIISRVLTQIGVDEQTAAEDACKIEHVISDASFRAIKAHMDAFGAAQPKP